MSTPPSMEPLFPLFILLYCCPRTSGLGVSSPLLCVPLLGTGGVQLAPGAAAHLRVLRGRVPEGTRDGLLCGVSGGYRGVAGLGAGRGEGQGGCHHLRQVSTGVQGRRGGERFADGGGTGHGGGWGGWGGVQQQRSPRSVWFKSVERWGLGIQKDTAGTIVAVCKVVYDWLVERMSVHVLRVGERRRVDGLSWRLGRCTGRTRRHQRPQLYGTLTLASL